MQLAGGRRRFLRCTRLI
ncbi:unnamed protein product [Coffea canephora]|uniref:Uncharacterized protein n=1 Tax=Coffea canephora TaxID=49390 RepID=A0A068VCN4_COFCA|nr:unnamed protein product [Coffea canephora]